MKSIVVRKAYGHRIALRFFTALFLAAIAVIAACFRQLAWIILLMCSPVLAGMIGMLLYYETWQVILEQDGIRKRVFGFSGKARGYSQIKDVVTRRSYTEQGIIRVTFSDNSSIKFRLEDENAEKAKKRILSYHSIRDIA